MSSDRGGKQDATVAERRRRNRVAVSCFSCRSLKTKCDGRKPVCSTCEHNGRSCVYMQRGISGGASNTVVVEQDYLRALEQRLEALENRSRLDSAQIGPIPRIESTTSLPPSSYRNERATGARHPGTPGASAAASSSGYPSAVVADADVSMGGVSFTQLILNALHGHESVKAYSRTTDNDVREQESRLTEQDLYTLPANASELLGQFFTLRHPLSPVFHVPSIRPLFDAALQCPPEQRSHHRSIFVLLNMIFAICTSHWVIDARGNPRAARRHYDIAISLIQPNLLRDWKLEHVQALLIGARYLQGSSCANECWNILGLAIRIAYGLGLHKDPPDTDPQPLRETKRRVWYAAYTLDVLLSMIYDRPSMIRSDECSVSLPTDLDDEYIQSAPMPRPPSTMSFSIEVIKLYRIIEAFKSQLNESVDSGRKVVELVMPLDEQYRKWHRSLPSHLILDYKAPTEQPWILALRGNMVRILIHRQSLMVTLRGLLGHQDVEDSVVSHALQSSRSICIHAAMESIDMVALRHEHTKKTMGLNWFNIYYCK
ncbi:Fungal Zn2-Cys6 binuclear cluster domain-containing protein isoform 2 [Cladophialophora immunda]|nr:Fungal Zn2-Cys6 binuclear cluster domain-containing protein isoform 2 [Cladophialophora immunda]